MKIRIRGDSIRLRLSQKEVAQISVGEKVQDITRFPLGTKLSYGLDTSSNVKEIEAHFENQQIMIVMPRQQATAWASSGDVALKANLPIEKTSDDQLFILIEKDFQCLKTRENEKEDESDLFVNPNAVHGSCG